MLIFLTRPFDFLDHRLAKHRKKADRIVSRQSGKSLLEDSQTSGNLLQNLGGLV